MLTRLFRYAANNAMRNTFLSISSIIVLTLLIFFINILALMHNVSFRIIDSINERLTISLYLDEQYDKNSLEVINLQNTIQKEIPQIVMTYKTKEEVIEELRSIEPELVGILERQNPLPETITLENIPLKSYDRLNRIIESKMFLLSGNTNDISGQEYFASYQKQFERIRQIVDIVDILQIALYAIIAIFLISIGIITYSIIGNFIYYYRHEIYITRLVGGSKLFIYGPFALQGMIYVFIAFLISSVLFVLLVSQLSEIFGFSGIGDIFQGNLSSILLLQGCIFIFIGGMSGFLSSRRYLQKSHT